MAKNEKENAKSPRPVPAKIAVNGGTEGSVPTPQNLGVPTPPLPFDPMAAMQGVAPGGDPSMGQGGAGGPMPREPFMADGDTVKMVQGLIFHWDKSQLRDLITFASHLLTHAEKAPAQAAAMPGTESGLPASNPAAPPMNQ